MICHVESIILSASLGKSNLVSKGKQVSFPINACRVFFFSEIPSIAYMSVQLIVTFRLLLGPHMNQLLVNLS